MAGLGYHYTVCIGPMSYSPPLLRFPLRFRLPERLLERLPLRFRLPERFLDWLPPVQFIQSPPVWLPLVWLPLVRFPPDWLPPERFPPDWLPPARFPPWLPPIGYRLSGCLAIAIGWIGCLESCYFDFDCCRIGYSLRHEQP